MLYGVIWGNNMEIFIKVLLTRIINFIKKLIYEFKKKQIDSKIEVSSKEQKDASKKASDDYNDFKSAYDEYKSRIRTDDL